MILEEGGRENEWNWSESVEGKKTGEAMAGGQAGARQRIEVPNRLRFFSFSGANWGTTLPAPVGWADK